MNPDCRRIDSTGKLTGNPKTAPDYLIRRHFPSKNLAHNGLAKALTTMSNQVSKCMSDANRQTVEFLGLKYGVIVILPPDKRAQRRSEAGGNADFIMRTLRF